MTPDELRGFLAGNPSADALLQACQHQSLALYGPHSGVRVAACRTATVTVTLDSEPVRAETAFTIVGALQVTLRELVHELAMREMGGVAMEVRA